ncbi:MAG: HAMP domain-containing histidine kinase [Idiomarina sp.]|nr:HAMP domain-containing histidine kinase [Idiomarina sp.]
MQTVDLTANRYLNFLLAATSLWMLGMALSTHLAWPVSLQDGGIEGYRQSWRWWLLTGLSLTLLVTLVLLGRVGERASEQDRVFLGLLSLTALWSAALAISGGAQNAANAIQLILIAAAFMTLPAGRAWVVFSLVVVVQALFLLAMFSQSHVGHSREASHDMLHYLGMSVTFLIAAVLLAVVIRRMQRSLQQQQYEVQRMREEQLRQEQIMAMGTASAQITHELATPLSTISMIYDELAERYPNQPMVAELAAPISQVRELLQHLRDVAEHIQTQRQHYLSVSDVYHQLRQQVTLNFPSAEVTWHLDPAAGDDDSFQIYCDLTLVPALLGLLRNSLAGSDHSEEGGRCEVSVRIQGDSWELTIKNATTPESLQRLQQMTKLGQRAVISQQGLGFGMLLSHATLERFGGSLRVHLNHQGIFFQHIQLPLKSAQPKTSAET